MEVGRARHPAARADGRGRRAHRRRLPGRPHQTIRRAAGERGARRRPAARVAAPDRRRVRAGGAPPRPHGRAQHLGAQHGAARRGDAALQRALRRRRLPAARHGGRLRRRLRYADRHVLGPAARRGLAGLQAPLDARRQGGRHRAGGRGQLAHQPRAHHAPRPGRRLRGARALHARPPRRPRARQAPAARLAREPSGAVRGRTQGRRRLQALARQRTAARPAPARCRRSEPADPGRHRPCGAVPVAREPRRRAAVRGGRRHGRAPLCAAASRLGRAAQDTRREPDVHARGVAGAAARDRGRRLATRRSARVRGAGVAAARAQGPAARGPAARGLRAARARLHDRHRAARGLRAAAAAAALARARHPRVAPRCRRADTARLARLRPRRARGRVPRLVGGARAAAVRGFHHRPCGLPRGARGRRLALGALRGVAARHRGRLVALRRRQPQPPPRREHRADRRLRPRADGAAAARGRAQRPVGRLEAQPARGPPELLLHQHPARCAGRLPHLPRGARRQDLARAAHDPRASDPAQRQAHRDAHLQGRSRRRLRQPRPEHHLAGGPRRRQQGGRGPLVDGGRPRQAAGLHLRRVPAGARSQDRRSHDLRCRRRDPRGAGGERTQDQLGQLPAELLPRVPAQAARRTRRHLDDERVPQPR